MIRFITGSVLALATLLGAYLLEGGNLLNLLALSGMLIAVFVPAFCILAVWDFKTYRQAWKDAIHGGKATEVKDSLALWTFAEQVSWLAGILAFITGGILILGPHDAGTASYMRALGVNLVAPIYGIFLALIAKILKARVAHLAK